MRPARRTDDLISMVYFLLIGCVLGGWAFLRVLGGERARQLQAIRAEIEYERAQAAEEAARQGRTP